MDKDSVISVLIQGREFADQLRKELHPTVTSIETCGFLLESILSTYDNALALINCMVSLGNGNHSSKIEAFNMLKKSNSLEGKQRSEVSDTDTVDKVHVSKKRKTSPGLSEQVLVCSETGVEGQAGDGYNWRKYGQKDILGANHPRAYYRCTHRHTQKCLATKQVQRIDDNPSMLHVIYRGKHTCIQEAKKQKKENQDVQKKEEDDEEEQLRQTIIIMKPEKVETQEFYDSFSFPSTPAEHENLGTQFSIEQKSLEGTSYSTPFLSPATSESFFSLSPSHMNDFGFSHSLWSSESDFAEIISNPAPMVDFSYDDLDFLIEQVDFGSPFFDASDYF